MPTYRVAANSYVIQQISYGTGAAQNVAGAVHSSGLFTLPDPPKPQDRPRIQAKGRAARIVTDPIADLDQIKTAMETVFPSGVPFPMERWAERQLSSPNSVIALDDENEKFFQAELNHELGWVNIAWWVPNSASDLNIVRESLFVLREVLGKTVATYPVAAGWLVWGSANEEALIDNWVTLFGPIVEKFTGENHPTLPKVQGNVWRAVSTVQQILDRCQELLG